MTNKPLYLRKLKDGKWIVLALDSEALVIDEDLAESFLQGTSINEKCNDETIEIFRQSGFYNNEQNASAVIPEEKDNKKMENSKICFANRGSACTFDNYIFNFSNRDSYWEHDYSSQNRFMEIHFFCNSFRCYYNNDS